MPTVIGVPPARCLNQGEERAAAFWRVKFRKTARFS
jgi:hypothetical protein